MRVTIDIPEKVLQEAMKHSGSSTRREAVLIALEEFNRRRRLARLAESLGTFEDFMPRDEMHKLRKAGDQRRTYPR